MSELTKDIESWLQQQVKSGRFKDIPDALQTVVTHYQATVIGAGKNDLWVKPLLDKAVQSLDAGKGKPATAVHSRLRKELKLEKA